MSRSRKLRGDGLIVPPQQPIAQAKIRDGQQGAAQQRSLIMSASFQGPIPPPETLRGFDEVIPGLAERIVGWVEEETAHRRDLEKREMSLYERAVKWDGWLQLGGMILHFVLLAGLFAVAWFALRGGHEIAGTAAIIAAIGTAIAAFRGGAKAANK